MAKSANADYHLTNYKLSRVLTGVPCIKEGDVLLPEPEAGEGSKRSYEPLYGLPELTFVPNHDPAEIGKRMRIGVVFGGGTAPGAIEMVIGIHNYLKRWNSTSSLVAFRYGLKGLITGDVISIDDNVIQYLIAEGGLGCIGTGAHQLSSYEYKIVAAQCQKVGLTGLVICGGSPYLTTALNLADYMLRNEVDLKVMSASKRLEVAHGRADKPFEVGFGFDSVTKLYSFLVGNLAADVASAQSSYHIVRLMGDEQSGSLTLEVALDTHPNVVFINEEVKANQWSLTDIVNKTCDVVCDRARMGVHYGMARVGFG